MLQINDLHKTYTGSSTALAGVTLTLAEDEIVCLLGPSGCGKTTLLRAVAGLEQIDRGSIHLRGQDLRQIPVHKRNFGFMFQEYALFPHKSVAENIAFGLRMDGRSRQQISQRVDDMLSLVNLSDHAQRSVFELSGGERQRVALARSLAPQPELLMLDEPLGSLDRALRQNLLTELRKILKTMNVTALYVTHDQEEAFAIADRIAVMRAGRISQIGPPEDVYQRPVDLSVARFLGFSNLLPATLTADSTVVTALGHFPLPPSARHHDPGAYTLLIRPEAARVFVSGEVTVANRHALQPLAPQPGSELHLVGTLISYSFRGSLFYIELAVHGEEGDIQLDFDLPAYQTSGVICRLAPTPIPNPGSPLRLVLYPALFTLLPSS